MIKLLLLSLLLCLTPLDRVTPTFKQYMDFLHENTISEKTYGVEEYMCGDYAKDTIKALRDSCFPVFFAIVDFGGEVNHMAIIFPADGKWWLIEPQTDELLTDTWIGRRGYVEVYRDCTVGQTGIAVCKGFMFEYWF